VHYDLTARVEVVTFNVSISITLFQINRRFAARQFVPMSSFYPVLRMPSGAQRAEPAPSGSRRRSRRAHRVISAQIRKRAATAAPTHSKKMKASLLPHIAGSRSRLWCAGAIFLRWHPL
jgi:hypothetical protein